MVWNVSVAVSLSTLPMMLDVRASSCGIQQTVLAKEHPEPEDLLSKPFYLKFTIRIPDWHLSFGFSLLTWSASPEMVQSLRLTRMQFADGILGSCVLTYACLHISLSCWMLFWDQKCARQGASLLWLSYGIHSMAWKLHQISQPQQLWLILPQLFGVLSMDLNIQPLCFWYTLPQTPNLACLDIYDV